MEMLNPKLVIDGIYAMHNMPCACCGARKAVYILNDGVFRPCWKCQETWELRRIPWWRGIFRRELGGGA